MKRVFGLLLVEAAAALVTAQQPLRIYVIDPEGGKAALWIAPSGETVLIDTGNPGERDLVRLKDVLTAAGVTKIDYLITTHYHIDHIGGLQELVKQFPVGTYVDHGPTVEGPVNPEFREQVPGFQTAYAALWAAARHLVVKPGDAVPVKGLDWRIVTSAGNALKTPMTGAPGAPAESRMRGTKRITTDPDAVGRAAASDACVADLATCCGTTNGVDVSQQSDRHACSRSRITANTEFTAARAGMNPRAAIMQNAPGRPAPEVTDLRRRRVSTSGAALVDTAGRAQHAGSSPSREEATCPAADCWRQPAFSARPPHAGLRIASRPIMARSRS